MCTYKECAGGDSGTGAMEESKKSFGLIRRICGIDRTDSDAWLAAAGLFAGQINDTNRSDLGFAKEAAAKCRPIRTICITNRSLVTGDFTEQICRVTSLGVSAVILREKDLPEAEYETLARKILRICDENQTLCILHSFANTAKKLQHPCIHLTMQQFLALSDEDRSYFQVLGVSTHTVEEAVTARRLGASYITASHIFQTACKAGLEPRGLSYLLDVCKAVEGFPVYALGGIHPHNAASCIEAGAAGVCMMSEFMK